MDLIKINYANESVNARDVYDFVFDGQHKKTAFNVWITRAVTKYGFIEGKDFQSFMIKSTGGRPKKDYAVTLDMSKELCMVSPTEKGKRARQYFIKCEAIAKEAYANSKALRMIGKDARKSLTDAVQESGENERMHGRGYSNYTNMVYDICGIKDDYKQFKSDQNSHHLYRDTLTAEQLKRVELAESLIKPMLELEKMYTEIKETLKPLFAKEKKRMSNTKDITGQ